MKRFAMLLMVVSIGLFAIGCTKEPTKKPPPDKGKPPVDKPVKKPVDKPVKLPTE